MGRGADPAEMGPAGAGEGGVTPSAQSAIGAAHGAERSKRPGRHPAEALPFFLGPTWPLTPLRSVRGSDGGWLIGGARARIVPVRCGEVVSHQAHNLEVAGSIPAAAISGKHDG